MLIRSVKGIGVGSSHQKCQVVFDIFAGCPNVFQRLLQITKEL